MESTKARMQHIGSALSGFWRRVPLAIRAIATGVLVAEIGISTWMASLMLVPGIWPLVVMIKADPLLPRTVTPGSIVRVAPTT